MIRAIATIAMNYGLVYDPTILQQLPKGQTIVFGAKMAKRLGRPIIGQSCLVLDDMGVKGWGRTDTIPNDCIIVGGFNTLTQALAVADVVTLIVRPVSTGGRVLGMQGFEEVSRTPLEDGRVVLEYKKC